MLQGGRVAFERHSDMPRHQQDAAKDHRLAHPQPAVGQQAAKHRNAIHQPAIRAQQIQPGLVTKQVVFGEIEQQQRLHAIERKAFPHLGEKADVHALGVAQEIIVTGLRDKAG